MRFCDNCGSYMKRTAEGFLCARCGKLVPTESENRWENSKKSATEGIYIIDQPADSLAIIPQVCPRCGNKEAFHWVSSISGEHAGVMTERTVEHFKCTKCSHAWTKIS